MKLKFVKCTKCDLVLGCYMMHHGLKNGGCKDFGKATKKERIRIKKLIRSMLQGKGKHKLAAGKFSVILGAKFKEQQKRRKVNEGIGKK